MRADYASRGGIDFIDDHFGTFPIAALAGMTLCFIGLLGWGLLSTRSKCASIGIAAVLASVAVCILGSIIGGTNLQGNKLATC